MKGFRRSHSSGRGWWASNMVRVRVWAAGPDPVAAGTVGAVDAAWSNGMAGRNGAIRAGDGGDPMYKFSGYLAAAPTQGFSPAVTAAIRKGPPTLFPSTSGDVRSEATASSGGSSIADILARLTPAGSRR